jgi:hypothetical protein
MGKAQRELAQGVQPPRGELKPVYRVADAPCRFETPCLTRPARAMRVVLPRIGLHRCTMTDDQLTPSRFLIRPGLNGACPPRTTPHPIPHVLPNRHSGSHLNFALPAFRPITLFSAALSTRSGGYDGCAARGAAKERVRLGSPISHRLTHGINW